MTSVVLGLQALEQAAKGEIHCGKCWDTGEVAYLGNGSTTSPGFSSSSIPCDKCAKGARAGAKFERQYGKRDKPKAAHMKAVKAKWAQVEAKRKIRN